MCGPHASLGGALPGLVEQTRLADAGGALDDHRAPHTLRDGAQCGVGALQLVLALEQCGRPGPGKCVHRVSAIVRRGGGWLQR